MNRPAARLLAVLVLLAAVTALPGAARAQPKEVVIGVIYPMSGPNAQPGIDGKPVIEIGTDVANGAADLPFPFYQKLKGMPGLRRRQDPRDLRRSPGEARAGPGRGRAHDHPGEGARAGRRLLLGGHRDGRPGGGAVRRSRSSSRSRRRRACYPARAQVVLPDLPPRRALHPGHVRLLPRPREEAQREVQDRRHHHEHQPFGADCGKVQEELAAKKYGVRGRR